MSSKIDPRLLKHFSKDELNVSSLSKDIDSSFQDINKSYQSLENTWKQYQREALNSYLQIDKYTNDHAQKLTQHEIKKLSNHLNLRLNKAVTKYESAQAKQNKEIKEKAGYLAFLHRQLSLFRDDVQAICEKEPTDKDKQVLQEVSKLVKSLERKLQGINEYVAKMDATNNSDRIWEKSIVGLEAAVEEKLALHTELLKAKEEKQKYYLFFLPRYWKTRRKVSKIKSLLTDSEKYPISIKEISKEIFSEMKKKAKILSPDEMKKKNAYYDEKFKRFRPYYKNALSREGQWSSVTRLFFKKSENNCYYAFIHEQEPKSKVPSSMRKKKKLLKNASANFFVVHDYALDENGNKNDLTVYKSYRGAQLPTVENAEYVFDQILKSEKSSQTDEEPYILFSGLLTSSRKLEGPMIKKHKNNIEVAARKRGVLFDVSNIGINTLANGTFEILGHAIRFGWHTDIQRYMNPSVEGLNDQMRRFFSSKVFQENRNQEELLNALIFVGLELRRRWDECDFAYEDGGYEFLAYWQVMHQLIGSKVYKNCKSGKDRTGEIESRVSDLLHEVMMKMEENDFDHKVEGISTEERLKSFQEAMGLDSRYALLHHKKVKRHIWTLGLMGIEKAPSTRNHEFFPKIEDNIEALENRNEMMDLDNEWMRHQQRLAMNRRITSFSSLMITGMNTAQRGYKYAEKKHGPFLQTTNPTKQSVSGFDRDFALMYALIRTGDLQSEEELRKIYSDFITRIGLDSFDENTRREIEAQFLQTFMKRIEKRSAYDFYLENKKSLEKLFLFIENEAKRPFQPLGKVVSS